MSSKDKIIFQFFGLPGAGKTFYFEEINKNIKPIYIKEKRNKVFFTILFFIFNPLTTIFYIKIIIKENKHNRKILYYKIFKLFIDTVANEQKAFLNKESVIIDQGIILFLMSIYERKIKEGELEIFLPYLRKNYFIYIIIASKKIRQKRMEARKRIPRSRIGRNYAISMQKIFKENEPIIINFIKKNFPYKIIENSKE